MTWNLTPGTWDVYLQRYVEGVFNPSTGSIDLTHADPWAARQIAIYNLPVAGWPASNPMIARVHVDKTAPAPTAPINPGSLYETEWTLPDGTQYIGEITGNLVVQTPPIPVYRQGAPLALQGETAVQWYSPSQPPLALPWTHFTGLPASPWGVGAERCGLWERHTSGPQYVYNYVWLNGRIKDQWWGVLDGDKVQGTQFYWNGGG